MSNEHQPIDIMHLNINHEVSRLNNEGLELITANQRCDGTALRKLSRALALVNRNHAAPMNIVGNQLPAPTIQAATLKSSVLVPGLEDECFYIHHQAFFLDPAILLSDPSNMYNLTSGAVLFNLGLVCHQFGIRHQDEGKLQCACRVYELCSQFALAQDGAPAVPQDQRQPLKLYTEYLQVLSWAALNNQSQIMYRLFGQEARAADLLNRQLAPALAGADATIQQSNFLTSDHVDGIVLNMVVVSRTGMSLIASPAA